MNLPESPPSLWLDTYGPYTPEPALQGKINVDIAVIGGGFTGLMTAYEIKRAEPGLDVALLEAKYIGYGASGRNGSFAMTVVGLGFGTMKMLYGKQFIKDAHTYMERAVDTLDDFILQNELDCDRTRPGFLRVATTPGYIKRLKNDIDLMKSLGFDGIDWIEADQVRSRVNSERYLGALWEPRLVLMNPVKLQREEKRLVQQAGVQVYENTPVLQINSQPKFTLKTQNGEVHCQKIVFATNAYSHFLSPLRHKQMPAFTYMVATEPLSAEQLEPIGWENGEGLEDARNLIHYYRLTPDKRLVMGGGPVGLVLGSNLDADSNLNAWNHLEKHIHFLFPSLRTARITHRWGGPFSVSLQLMPALGYLCDHNAVYSLGCIGHGVSMSHLNAQVFRDLLLERKTDLTENPFVNRRVIPWPPEPLRYAVGTTLRTYLQLEDWWYERNLESV
jgi:glycine/D-amino acid oxidase-like deaminating enzyme